MVSIRKEIHTSASPGQAWDGNGCRFVRTRDFLPDEARDDVVPLVEGGCDAFRRNVDRTLESTGEVSQ